jgi:translation initiation factor IF-1
MAPNNSFIPEPRRIEAGDEAKWTFRVVIHNGDTRSAEISERYADFVAMPLVADRDQDKVKVLWPVDPERAKIPFKLPEDLTGWPEIPVWQKDVRAFVEKVKELGLMPERK